MSSPELKRAQEEKAARLQARNVAIENADDILERTSRQLSPVKGDLMALRLSLQELDKLISPARDIRGISGYLSMKESKVLLEKLRKLPPEIYEELDALVGLPPQQPTTGENFRDLLQSLLLLK